MFNDLDWLQSESIAVCMDMSDGKPAVVIFRSTECMRRYAYGEELSPGRDFIVVGRFLHEVQAIEFCQSKALRAIHDALWGV